MRIFKIIAAAGLLSMLAAGGCQTAGFTEQDRAAIGKASDQWFTDTAAGKFDAVAAHYTDDGVVLPPGAGPVTGRKDIAVLFSKMAKIENLKWGRREVVGNGDLAYAWGVFSLDVTPPGASKPIHDVGKYIEIWRRQADGSWKITRDIYNSDVAGN